MGTELILPVYLDTGYLLDLLATIEGGFSVVEKISSKSSRAVSTDGNVRLEGGTEFGIPNVLSLLKLSLSAFVAKSNKSSDDRESTIERTHTYGSLLHRLREYLMEQNLLKVVDGKESTWNAIRPSDFVEIRGIFHFNPLATSLKILDQILAMTEAISVIPEPQKKNTGRREVEKSHSQMEQFRALVTKMLAAIEMENSKIFVIDAPNLAGIRAVVLLTTEYLRDKAGAEVSNREFRLVGKVVRRIDKDSNERIDLLVGSGVGALPDTLLDGMFASLGNNSAGMNIPKAESKILGPALEIVPIAVYV